MNEVMEVKKKKKIVENKKLLNLMKIKVLLFKTSNRMCCYDYYTD
jgi:hypothetical protein